MGSRHIDPHNIARNDDGRFTAACAEHDLPFNPGWNGNMHDE